MLTELIHILLQEKDELSEYIDLVPSIYNPIYISLAIFIFLFVLIFISYKHIYNPLLKKHKREQELYEENTAKLIASFAELDPNPIIRIDAEGTIISLNKSAPRAFRNIKLNESIIDTILNISDFDIKEAISADKQIILSKKINDRFYDINFHGISYLGMAQLYFWDTTLKREYEEQMSNYQQLIKNTSATLQKMQEEERTRISQELHDAVGQNLLLVKLNINNYKKSIEDEDYNHTMEILESAISKVREVSHNLRPINLEELGLTTLIKAMCRNISQESDLEYNLQLPKKTITWPKDTQICIYRVIQESLNNIIRYSKANKFSVSITEEADIITLLVSDNGIGFNPRKLLNDKYISEGLGIMSMQENIERLNGSFQIDSSINQGTNIIATFPNNNINDETKSEH